MQDLSINRRTFLQTNTALVVGLGSGAMIVGDAAAQAAASAVVGPAPTQLDTWIRIAADGGVTVNFGKMDCGQGLDVITTVHGKTPAQKVKVNAHITERWGPSRASWATSAPFTSRDCKLQPQRAQ